MFAAALKPDAKTLLLQGKRKEAVALTKNIRSKDAQRKSLLVAEQFLTTEGFQKYQEAKAYADEELWSDCLKNINQVVSGDADNLVLMRLKAKCQMKSGVSAEAGKTLFEILEYDAHDPEALMGLATLMMLQKKYEEAIRTLEPLTKADVRAGLDREKLSILTAQIHLEAGHFEDSIDVLQKDHERYIDHLEVIYKLGEYNDKKKGNEWQTRRAYALFLSRYKKLADSDARKNRLQPFYAEAQARLSALDKKLEVKSAD